MYEMYLYLDDEMQNYTNLTQLQLVDDDEVVIDRIVLEHDEVDEVEQYVQKQYTILKKYLI